MRYTKYLALLSVLMIPLAYSQAQVSVGVGIGPVYGRIGAPPVCAYGYYSYYPYACAPYGYYGPNWFVNGVFIGAGPWYHSYWGHPGWGYRPGYYGRGWYGRGPAFRGYNRGEAFHGSPRGGEMHAYNGGGFHGNPGFHGGGFHGGGGRR